MYGGKLVPGINIRRYANCKNLVSFHQSAFLAPGMLSMVRNDSRMPNSPIESENLFETRQYHGVIRSPLPIGVITAQLIQRITQKTAHRDVPPNILDHSDQ